jgi:hypothetical protein
MNCWESFYMKAFHQRNIFEEQKVSDINPLYELAEHVTQPVTHSPIESAPEQCDIYTSARVSPANFDIC